ncbi:MAG: hypothetical protein RI953_1959, partial [Pseudomonadota bacterium]
SQYIPQFFEMELRLQEVLAQVSLATR